MFKTKTEHTNESHTEIERRVERKGSLEPYYIANATNPSQQILSEEEERGLYSLRPVQQIINTFINDLDELKPVFDLQYRCRYPEVEHVTDLKPNEVPGMLERLSLYRILESHFYERIIICQRCSSANLAPKYLCARCKSANISKHQTIEHISCGYVAMEDEFILNNEINHIICPRCNVSLRPNSTDLNINDEGWFLCDDCSKRSREPVIMYACRQCNRMMYVGDVSFVNLQSYTLSKAIDMNSIVLIEPLRDALVKLNYQIESPGVIVGQSKTQYKFDIVAHKKDNNGNNISTLVLDVVYSNVIVTESHLNKLFCAIFDTKVDHSVMVAVPEVTDTSRRLAEQYGITLIVGNDIRDISEKLKTVAINNDKNTNNKNNNKNMQQ
jgi:hypothetical protein